MLNSFFAFFSSDLPNGRFIFYKYSGPRLFFQTFFPPISRIRDNTELNYHPAFHSKTNCSETSKNSHQSMSSNRYLYDCDTNTKIQVLCDIKLRRLRKTFRSIVLPLLSRSNSFRCLTTLL
jgi:hypothetical protein